MKNFLIIIFFAVLVLFITNIVHAKPKTKTIYGRSLDGFSRVKIKNNVRFKYLITELYVPSAKMIKL